MRGSQETNRLTETTDISCCKMWGFYGLGRQSSINQNCRLPRWLRDSVQENASLIRSLQLWSSSAMAAQWPLYLTLVLRRAVVLKIPSTNSNGL